MANAKNIFSIISAEEVLEIVKRFRNHLEAQGIPVEKMYIYGSYAKGNPRYGSDIDLCVISPAFEDRLEANLMLRREALKVDPRIEPVGYHPHQFEDWIPLVWEIQTHGVEVEPEQLVSI